MSKPINLKGQTFSRLYVVRKAGRDKYKNILWLCLCECGTEIKVSTGALRSNNTKSCGCYSGGVKGNKTVKERSPEVKRYKHLADLDRRENCVHTIPTCLNFFYRFHDLPCKGCGNFKQADFI